MAKTSIEWAQHVWNPVRGCTRISKGCERCYAERQAARFCVEPKGPCLPIPPFAGFVQITPSGPRWTGRVELIKHMLSVPLKRRTPTTYFVNSMSDLFHEALPDEAIDRIFAVMALCPQHTFQVLTKRAERMREYFARHGNGSRSRMVECVAIGTGNVRSGSWIDPLPNVWLGVSVEDQQTADQRIPHLLRTPAAVRFVSYEPALGPVDLRKLHSLDYHENTIGYETYPLRGMQAMPDCDWPHAKLDWVICGGESGPGARPFDIAWARQVIAQCKAAGVPCFVKQVTERGRRVPFEQWPSDIQIRETPHALSRSSESSTCQR